MVAATHDKPLDIGAARFERPVQVVELEDCQSQAKVRARPTIL